MFSGQRESPLFNTEVGHNIIDNEEAIKPLIITFSSLNLQNVDVNHLWFYNKMALHAIQLNKTIQIVPFNSAGLIFVRLYEVFFYVVVET